ncbi:MAG: transcription initiation factor IIB [Candidatus Odinarchaeota archaeon]|nr:transcription initiation factor IIB [Candidatus Odinarchaeota archaeon]
MGEIKLTEDVVNKKEGVMVCPECGSTTILFDPARGEHVCASCGLVISEHVVDTGPEWRAFTHEELEKRSRTGAPTSYRFADKGLSTTISWSDRDAHGRKLSPSRRAQIYRLRRWNIRTTVRRSLADGLIELSRIASQMGIPNDVSETAALLYRKAVEKRLTRGHPVSAMAAAAVYLACRIHKIPRPLDEVVAQAKSDRKDVSKCVRVLIRRLKQEFPRPTAINFIPRFAAELGLSTRTQRRAIEIMKKAQEVGITAGKDPSGLAAATIYIASILEGERRTQRQIAEVAHVTEVTVRNRYKELCKKLGIKIKV